MRILIISSEGPPLMRSGALADVLEALPRELKNVGMKWRLRCRFIEKLGRTRGTRSALRE